MAPSNSQPFVRTKTLKIGFFFKKEKPVFSFLKKNPIFKVFVLTNGCELEGAIWAFDRSNWYYKTTKFEPQRMPCQGKPLKNFIFLSGILLRKNGGAFQLGTMKEVDWCHGNSRFCWGIHLKLTLHFTFAT